MPASHPKTPPTTVPAQARLVPPSGSFVAFSVAKSFKPTFSAKSTDVSLFDNRYPSPPVSISPRPPHFWHSPLPPQAGQAVTEPDGPEKDTPSP
jgi:hypothetical protein